MAQEDFVRVFTFDGRGGNPCPVTIDADGMASADMQAIARRHGLESVFVLPAKSGDYDFTFRFFVPNHEMEMCGHATIGALWALAERRRLPGSTVRVATRSGPVTGFVGQADGGDPVIEITQPPGKVAALTKDQEEAVLSALKINRRSLADLPCQNAVTSRVKTLVPMKSPEHLDALMIDMREVEAACCEIGSTGLYPYAVADAAARTFEARQFPRSSGYPEDPATGIAATALAFGLLANGLIEADDQAIRVFQGRAMGSRSKICVRIGFADGKPVGCLMGGAVTPSAPI